MSPLGVPRGPRGHGGERAGCCGASLRWGAGGTAGGTGSFPLPHLQTGSWAESMTRVLGCHCFAPLCHISWVWGALCDVVLSTTLLLSDLLSAAPFPSCFPTNGDAAAGRRGSGCPWKGLSPCPLMGALQGLSTSPWCSSCCGADPLPKALPHSPSWKPHGYKRVGAGQSCSGWGLWVQRSRSTSPWLRYAG